MRWPFSAVDSPGQDCSFARRAAAMLAAARSCSEEHPLDGDEVRRDRIVAALERAIARQARRKRLLKVLLAVVVACVTAAIALRTIA